MGNKRGKTPVRRRAAIETTSHPNGSQQRWFLPAVLGFSFLVYARSLGFEFVHDDLDQIVFNPRVHSWQYVLDYFKSNVWGHQSPFGSYYRPLFLLWLRLNDALFGNAAWAWHASTIAVHLLAVALFYVVVRKLASDEKVAAIASLIFALHPAHIESVAWISGVTDPLVTCAVLGSLLCYLRWQEQANGKWISGSLALYFAALLFKETGIVLLFAVALLAWLRRRESGMWRPLIPFCCVTAAYFAMRTMALHGLGYQPNPVRLHDVLLSAPALLAYYFRILLVPVGLLPFHNFAVVTTLTWKSFLLPCAGVLVFVAIALALYLKLKSAQHRTAALVAYLWLAVPLFLALQLSHLPKLYFVQDRYTYVPSLGFAILVALALDRFAVKAATYAVLLIAIAYGALTLAQQGIWADNVRVYALGCKVFPDNNGMRMQLANVLMMKDRCGEAIPLFEEAVDATKQSTEYKDQTNRWTATANIGLCYAKADNLPMAITYLERAQALHPDQALKLQIEILRKDMSLRK